MDPHIHPERFGDSPDPGKGDESVSYLRRLKSDLAQAPPPVAAAKPGSTAIAAEPAIDWKERRQSPRLRCSGSAEFRALGTDVRMWGTLTDISLHGCYVEMNTTFPTGTRVDLVLKSFGIRIHSPGTVRATYPFLGMGICFTEIDIEEHQRLKQLLAALAGQKDFAPSVAADESAKKEAVAAADLRAFFDAITEFYQKQQLLSREEFYQIAKRVRRP
ncbi:MAG: PilZ domain-containing protein [Terriglobales bacterium]